MPTNFPNEHYLKKLLIQIFNLYLLRQQFSCFFRIFIIQGIVFHLIYLLLYTCSSTGSLFLLSQFTCFYLFRFELR